MINSESSEVCALGNIYILQNTGILLIQPCNEVLSKQKT